MKSLPLLISVYTTVYNSRKTVKESLESIIKALEGFNYEVVVIDNFSTDGTYEAFLDYSKKYPVRIYRYRCSRGLGRNVASKLSRGRYLIYVDLDCMYNSYLLKRLISGYLHSKYRDVKCFGLLICPEHILRDCNFRDLNRTEDVDLTTRLHKYNLIISSPPLKEPIRVEMRTARSNVSKSGVIRNHSSEKRYAKSILGYIKREIRNKLDFVTGGAITLAKFVREEIYLWHTNWLVLLVRLLLILPFMTLCKLLKRPVFEGDPMLSNHLYICYKALKGYVNPIEMGFSKNDLAVLSLDDPVIRYISRFHPDIIDAVKKVHPRAKLAD